MSSSIYNNFSNLSQILEKIKKNKQKLKNENFDPKLKIKKK